MKRNLVNVSPLILAAACTLLAVIIGSFAVNNYRREKQLMTGALLQKGVSVIRSVDSGVRVSLRGFLFGTPEERYRWVDHIQDIISQVMDEEDIHFIEIVDSKGVILAATNPEMIGTKISSRTAEFITAGKRGAPAFRLYRGQGEQPSGFQVSEPYAPRMPKNLPHHNMMRGRGMMERFSRDGLPDGPWREELARLQEEKFSILVELDIEAFDKAVQRQMLQIIILSIVLLLVGIGGWLSLLTLQGLRGSQSRLKQIRAFNDILIESLPVGIIATDESGTIQMINSAAEEIVGLRGDQALMRSPGEVLPSWLAGCFQEKDKAPGKPVSQERVVEDGEGNKRTLFLSVLPIAEGGDRSVGDVLLLQDLSEVRGLETQLRRSERLAALGKMAAGVAHELRNPLSSIKGLALLLKGKVKADVEGVETAEVMVQEVERLNRSISELLDYARHDKLSRTEVGLRGLLEKTLTLVGVDAEQQGLSIITSFTEKPDVVLVDEDKMNQVLLNILLNAVQAVGEGGEISVRTEADNGKVICTVEDNGVGVDKEDLPKVFDPYFTTKSDGTGLGLAISAKIVEEHGGEISIDSRKDEGTTVRVSLSAA